MLKSCHMWRDIRQSSFSSSGLVSLCVCYRYTEENGDLVDSILTSYLKKLDLFEPVDEDLNSWIMDSLDDLVSQHEFSEAQKRMFARIEDERAQKAI